MQQNKTLFLVIIGVAVLAVIGMLVIRPLLSEPLNLPASPQEVTIQVVVAPSIKPWVDQAAQEFNQANPKTQVQIITADSLVPEAQFSSNPQAVPPAAWLAEAGFIVEMAGNSQEFGDSRPVAGTALAWGAFNNKLEEFGQKYGGVNWAALHQSATEPNSTLKVVLASPHNTAEGLAALASAAAHLNKQTLTGADASSAEPWLTETLKESARTSLNLGPKPAEAFATRGASIGDVGLLSQASWRSAGLQNRPDFSITPTQPAVTLDYPLAIWTGERATPEGQQAAAAFRDFLLSDAQQSALATYFFDRANAVDPNSLQVDGQAALTLLRWAERELR
ncbi:MAG: substrate-binding domain-containing protein [Anaerolineae bacterium]|nr:substrate-binding domain-containing protein [Anaerolineae bacterium]